MNKTALVAGTGIAFVIAFVLASTLYSKGQNQVQNTAAPENMQQVQREHSPLMGPPNAKVTIVEFFDPACGTCRAFYPLVKKLMDDNPGKVNLVLRYLPLHQNSDVIVSILDAARLQGSFAPVLARTYQSTEQWIQHHVADPQKFWQQLDGLGLDMPKLQEDIKSPEIARRIKLDMDDAQSLGVNKTPGFFVNGKPLKQFGYQQLKSLVESEIAANY
jgi:protein-disulfide isomerase